MNTAGVFETVLYANDLAAAEKFYRNVFGLDVLYRSEFFVVFRHGTGVLLFFDPVSSAAAGRDVPSHGAMGPGHLAFGVRAEDLDYWRSQLAENNIEIESEITWESGGLSIYFRDPAGNSIELAPPTLWGGGWDF